jgi:hypothetical protein
VSLPHVTVVIPTLKGRRWLPNCIDSLRAQTFPIAEIIVIDNASSDGSREWLISQHDLRVIRNETNVGFAAACNQGIRASRSPYIALLNDDTRAEPQWLEALMHAMDATLLGNKRIGSCASLMLFADQPHLIQSAGIAIDRASIAWDRLGGQPVESAGDTKLIFGASGGAALYRREMLDEIGLFDERFFAYLEDVDLAWRAQNAGWRCAFAPHARVLHFTSATSGEGSAFKRRLLGRNKMWLIAKNANGRDLPVVVMYDVAAVIYALLLRGDSSHLLGRFDAVRRLPEFFRNRSKSHSDLSRWFEPLVPLWRVAWRYRHLSPTRDR